MSRPAYAYFTGAVAITVATVYGVHYIQKAEAAVCIDVPTAVARKAYWRQESNQPNALCPKVAVAQDLDVGMAKGRSPSAYLQLTSIIV